MNMFILSFVFFSPLMDHTHNAKDLHLYILQQTKQLTKKIIFFKDVLPAHHTSQVCASGILVLLIVRNETLQVWYSLHWYNVCSKFNQNLLIRSWVEKYRHSQPHMWYIHAHCVNNWKFNYWIYYYFHEVKLLLSN